VRPEDLPVEAASAYRVWRNVFGLSESAALVAVQQDGLVEVSEGDRLAGSFGRIFGLSTEAARVAAEGRNGPLRSVSESGPVSEWVEKARAALSEMSDAECDAMLVEERRRRAAEAASGQSSGPRPAVVSERVGGR
jgi:hypothetical protein